MVKVKIVAISKDEGAYLPEWIFHHLYFGFAAIDIYVNRTTDNSAAILENICSKYDNVNYFSSDWVDVVDTHVTKKMQQIVYSLAFYQKENQENFTHILFIDIDEFWTPLDFKTSINEFVESLPNDHISCSFPWFTMVGEEDKLSFLPKNIYGHNNSLVKTLCRTTASIEKMRVHYPVFKMSAGERSVMPNGLSFERSADDPQKVAKNLMSSDDYPCTIIHRMYRSEEEYLAMLYRGNPEDASQIKFNRVGWVAPHYSGQPSLSGEVLLSVNDNNRLKYDSSKSAFIRELNIGYLMVEANEFVTQRYSSVVNILPKVLADNFKAASRVLQGISDPEIRRHVENMRSGAPSDEQLKKKLNSFNFERGRAAKNLSNLSTVFAESGTKSVSIAISDNAHNLSIAIKNVDNFVDALRNMALFFEERNDIDNAYQLMRVAYLYRPNGFTIKTKFYEYSAIVN